MLGDKPVAGRDRGGGAKILDPVGDGDWWYFEGEPCSYGMNRAAVRFAHDSHKILALEYCKLVADWQARLRPTGCPRTR